MLSHQNHSLPDTLCSLVCVCVSSVCVRQTVCEMSVFVCFSLNMFLCVILWQEVKSWSSVFSLCHYSRRHIIMHFMVWWNIQYILVWSWGYLTGALIHHIGDYSASHAKNTHITNTKSLYKLNKILDEITDKEQTMHNAGKVMCDHFSISREIIKKPKRNVQKTGYNYISRDFLWAVMTACAFPDPIIYMTKCLYVKLKLPVKVNEVLTEGFEGCPLSTALYKLSINLFNSQD